MRKVLGVFFILLVTILGIVLGVAWSLRSTILGSSTPWKTALRDTHVYDRLLTDFVPQLVSDPTRVGSLLENAPITASDVTTLTQQVVTPAFVQQQVEPALDTVFALAYGRENLQTFSFAIPLQDIKQRLPIAIQDLLVAKLRALPVCTKAQLADYAKRKSLDNALPPCLPKGTSAQDVVSASGKISDITANIPSSYDAAHAIRTAFEKSSGQTLSSKLGVIQDKIALGQHVLYLLTILWMLLVVGTGALFLPRWRRVLQWLGASLLPASVLFGTGVIIGWGNVPKSISVHDPLQQTVVTIFQPVVTGLGVDIYHRALLFAGIGFAVALVCIIGSFFISDRSRLKSS